MRAFLWTGCLSYLTIGLAHVIIGALLPELLMHYGKDYSSGGLLVALQFFGFLIGVLAGPWFSKLFGKRNALLLCLLCLGLSEFVFFLLPAWGIVLITAPFAGFGFGMVETVIGALVMGSLNDTRKTVVMTRLEVFFGVGALAMPLAASFWITAGSWRGAFLTLSLISFMVLGLWAFLPMRSMAQAISRVGADEMITGFKVQARGLNRGLGRLLTLFIFIFAIYVGTEMSIANFLPSILLENAGVPPELGALSVTCFWGAMAVGRLFAAKLAERLGKALYLCISCAGGTLLLAMFAGTGSAVYSYVVIVLLGLMMSGMFAIALVYANGFFPGREERVTSVLIASGGIGGALIPLLTGWCMDHMSLSMTLLLLVAAYMLLLGLMVAAIRYQGHRLKEESPYRG